MYDRRLGRSYLHHDQNKERDPDTRASCEGLLHIEALFVELDLDIAQIFHMYTGDSRSWHRKAPCRYLVDY